MKGETIEQCPLCSTERVAGETYCANSKCGYEFGETTKPEQQTKPQDTSSQTDEEWLEDAKKELPDWPDDALLSYKENGWSVEQLVEWKNNNE